MTGSLDFVAVDFETANFSTGSPCSVGLVRVRNGEIVDERHWLMRPPLGLDHFEPRNIGIHHITPEMVEDEPRWAERLPQLVDFVGDDVLIAHNASFDLGVIKNATEYDGLALPTFDFLCTVVLSRRALTLPNYKLPTVLASIGEPLKDHHHALADARGVVAIVKGISALQKERDIRALAKKLGVSVGHLSDDAYRSCRNAAPRSMPRAESYRGKVTPLRW